MLVFVVIVAARSGRHSLFAQQDDAFVRQTGCYSDEGMALMAARKRGSGEVRDLTIEILKGIRSELVKLREEGQETRHELEKLRHETTRGFAMLTRRVDHLVEFSGERWRDHEARLKKIESRLKIA